MFRNMIAAIQRGEARRNTTAPWFNFWGTNTEQMHIQITLLGCDHIQRMYE